MATISSSHKDTFVIDHLPPQDQWPEMIFEIPDVRYPARLNCASELLDRWVSGGQGDALCITGPTGKATYAQLQHKANQIANVLTHELKLVPGNRVLLRGFNSLNMAVCWLALAKAGLIAVTTMPLLRAKELTDVIDKAQLSAALCDKRLEAELVAALPNCPSLKHILYFGDGSDAGLEARSAKQPTAFTNVDTAAADPMLIAFTSGTTGKPKGTVHFHRDVLAMCDSFAKHTLKMSAGDRCIGTPPLAFTFGLGASLAFPMRFCASTVLVEKMSPAEMLAHIDEWQATIAWSAPTFYRQMSPLAKNYKLGSLKQCVSAGEALPLSTRVMWREASGIEMVDGIGATEMLHIFIAAAGADVRPGATGKVVPGYIACVMDDEGKEVPPGTVGRLAVKGPTGCRYLADERQRKYVQNGWNFTGDAYTMDADGYFWYQARTDDMIISAGYNIAGPEVEDALLKHPAVAECAVVGKQDDDRGMIVKAFCVLRPDFKRDNTMVKELQDFVKNAIAPYKYPREIEFMDAMPRTETGKLQRYKLR